jgi:hypothetical protein
MATICLYFIKSNRTFLMQQLRFSSFNALLNVQPRVHMLALHGFFYIVCMCYVRKGNYFTLDMKITILNMTWPSTNMTQGCVGT